MLVFFAPFTLFFTSSQNSAIKPLSNKTIPVLNFHSVAPKPIFFIRTQFAWF